MPFFLRKIRKAKWLNDKGLSWLQPSDLQADAVFDLKTDDNSLSVWHVEDDESNLEQVLVAVGASLDYLTNLDYALADQDLLLETGIKMTATTGKTGYRVANQWHRDLVELTAERVLEIARTIQTRGLRLDRVLSKKLAALLKKRIESGDVDLSSLNEHLRAEIQATLL
jgi:hypothetical protein